MVSMHPACPLHVGRHNERIEDLGDASIPYASSILCQTEWMISWTKNSEVNKTWININANGTHGWSVAQGQPMKGLKPIEVLGWWIRIVRPVLYNQGVNGINPTHPRHSFHLAMAQIEGIIRRPQAPISICFSSLPPSLIMLDAGEQRWGQRRSSQIQHCALGFFRWLNV